MVTTVPVSRLILLIKRNSPFALRWPFKKFIERSLEKKRPKSVVNKIDGYMSTNQEP